LNTATGEVPGKTANRHTSAEFVKFLVDKTSIHIIADNLSTHKTTAVQGFLSAHPNVQLHYTPTYSSWLNQVEIWFSKIQRDLIAWRLPIQDRPPPTNHPPLQQSSSPFKWTYKNTDRRIR
jgi:hypothetical protein